jgi:ADP-heptose:LPS heptosyltransferase
MSLSTQPESILVIRSGAVGDFILTTPVIASLRAAYPDAQLRVAGNPDRVSLIANEIDEILDINDAGWASFFVRNARPAGRIADLVSSTNLVVNFIPDADRVFADNLRHLSRGCVLGHPPHPPDDGSVHIVDHLLSALEPLNIPTRPQPVLMPEMALPLPAGLGPPYIVIHPGSGGANKVWPIERFAEVADQLVEHGRIVISSGPADDKIIAAMKTLLPAALIVAPSSLPDLARLYATARLYIGNDSGPSHLAAAVGTPTVAIFGPTDPRIWQPRGLCVEIVAAHLNIPGESRLESITVSQVIEAANRLVSPKPR